MSAHAHEDSRIDEPFATMVPEQLIGGPLRTPEQRLMAAVLEDAMRELIRPGGDWRGARARRRNEVEAWFDSDDTAWPFSFLNVCEALDLDPGGLRVRLGGRQRAGRGSRRMRS